jgi:endonuclease III
MPASRSHLTKILDRLESFYGPQQPTSPTDPYRFIVWWHCGYPPGEAACAKGWASLNEKIGVEPAQLLAASTRKLTGALKPGGLIPELRAARLKQVASRVEKEFAGDLRAALLGPLAQARKTLRTFPGIAGPGADRILLFGQIAPVAAVPSNCPYVLTRILQGPQTGPYADSYRDAQRALETALPEDFAARTRAYLLLKRHGQDLCKRTKPKCGQCPVNSSCKYFAGLPPSS